MRSVLYFLVSAVVTSSIVTTALLFHPLALQGMRSPAASPSLTPQVAVSTPIPRSTVPSAIAPSPVRTPEPATSPTPIAQTRYGHHRYQEIAASDLTLVASYGLGQFERYEFLEKNAAKAFMHMQYAARENGVWLIVISAFRDYQRQQTLFEKQTARFGSETEAAKWSAPPGYSEHHTGYTVDLGDGMERDQDLNSHFDRTSAFRWLQANAGQYGFELSFSPHNPDGVSYEPWHWRFVGDDRAKQVFRAVR